MGKIKRADLDLIRCFAIIFVISVHGLSYVGFYELSNPSITLFVCHSDNFTGSTVFQHKHTQKIHQNSYYNLNKQSHPYSLSQK